MQSPDGPRARKKQETRDAIVTAALRLFREKGFDATTIDEIAAAVGVSSRTFFRYFPTKEDVVFLDQIFEDAVLAREMAVARRGESDLDRVERAALAVARVTAHHGEVGMEMFELLLGTPSLLARGFQATLAAERVVIEGLLARGRHDARREAQVRLLAACAIAAFRAGYVSWIASGAKGSAEPFIAEGMTALRRGLGAETAGRGRADDARPEPDATTGASPARQPRKAPRRRLEGDRGPDER